jgi:hypothetical protein
MLESRLAVRTYSLGENQHLASAEHGHLQKSARQRLLETGGDHRHPGATEATLSRWLEQEGALLGYHDVLSSWPSSCC